MTTPLTTIADVLIEFILSLLRDPAAMAEFEKNPETTLARNGLSNVCAADVQAVKPIIIEHPTVQPRPEPPHPGPGPGPGPIRPEPPVIKEIKTVAQTFHIDNRSTIVDQSVNQNIWAHGDVTQVFDQKAIIASGDAANAAGRDVDNSTSDVTTGDVSIGNKTTDVTINDSYNDSSSHTDTTVDATITDSFNDSSSHATTDTTVTDSFNATSDVSSNTDVSVVTGDSSPVTLSADSHDSSAAAASAVDFGDDSPYDHAGLLDAALPSDLPIDDQP